MNISFGTFVKKTVTGILALILAVNLLPGSFLNDAGIVRETEAATTLKSPRIKEDPSMAAGQKVTWDCVWYGRYPQTEIVDKADTCGTYGMDFAADGDYEVDSNLYDKLCNAAGWNDLGDITISGTKYRRIKAADAICVEDEDGHYHWDSTAKYHYFRYDPIKWRVLKASAGNVLLLADKALDNQMYHPSGTSNTWNKSAIRTWLRAVSANGFDYTYNGFAETAFSGTERAAYYTMSVKNEANIQYGTEGSDNTDERCFLLSESEVYGNATETGYGFSATYTIEDEARKAKSSTYAKAMGTYSYTSTDDKGNCDWWLRSPGRYTDYAAIVTNTGSVDSCGVKVNYDYIGIRPVICMQSLNTEVWSYAGTVCSDGTMTEKEPESSYSLKNPRIEADSSMEAKQKVTWDCVWFGTYPQTEIVDQASTCGIYGKDLAVEGDYEVNSELYTKLQNTSGWSTSTETKTIDGIKYKRIKKDQATDASTFSYYKWDSEDKYHYFRFDPVKWRVLEVYGGDALLLADKVLDDQPYHTANTSITWEKSTIRSWLNGYSQIENEQGIDYRDKGFRDMILKNYSDTSELSAWYQMNEDNIGSHTPGGNKTASWFFLLSESEVYYTPQANSYGFVTSSTTMDEARGAKSSTYAKAMGAWVFANGNSNWWLRSPGLHENYAACGYVYGDVSSQGFLVNNNDIGVRPATVLKLTSDYWKYAGTVCSDKTKKEIHINHSWDEGTVTKKPTCGEKGIVTYTCTIDGCEETKTSEIAATGKHTYKTTINGNTATMTCSVCGHSYTKTLSDESATILKEPVIETEPLMRGGQKATWNCIWFGSYPQTEIVDRDVRCGIFDRAYNDGGEYEVNDDLYTSLENATGWNDRGDITIDGTKYRRMKKSDARSVNTDIAFYKWDAEDTYHYFRYDPIKWRILKLSSGKAFLLADKILDYQPFNDVSRSYYTWEKGTIRSWLNNYGAAKNGRNIDYSESGFKNTAFNNSEQNVILETPLTNGNNSKFGTVGGSDTADKVFLLSEADVTTEIANQYGFQIGYNTYDEARVAKSSTFAKAMGTYGNFTLIRAYSIGCSAWWLRSPGKDNEQVEYVTTYGDADVSGALVYLNEGVRPAINISLSSNLWKYAGTVCSDGTVKEKCTDHRWDKGTVTKKATCAEKGIMTYVCTKDNCGATKTELIAETGLHSFKTTISGQTKTYKCSVCGYSYTEKLPADNAEVKSAAIVNKKTDTDVSGADYGKTCARISKATSTSITIKWNGVSGATGYQVYVSKCNAGGKVYQLKYVKAAGKTARSYTYNKLTKGTYYKFLVMAVKGTKALSISKTIHIATGGGKYTNAKSMTLNVTSISLKKGKTKAIKVKKTTKYNSKLKLAAHRAVKYETSNKKIATVSAKGVVKGVKKGSCYVYVYAQDGVYKKLKVTVK